MIKSEYKMPQKMDADIKTPSPLQIGGKRDLAAYESWRENVLVGASSQIPVNWVEISDHLNLTTDERGAIRSSCSARNFALYRTRSDVTPAGLAAMARQLGLVQFDRPPLAGTDGISRIAASETDHEANFIPFSNKALTWHTDGYYATGPESVQSFVLHCVCRATTGGENALLDPRIAYIRLRQDDPEHIEALMRQDALTIPAHIANGREIRPAVTGPVFSVRANGHLHTRYTARKRHVVWAEDRLIDRARDALAEILRDDPGITRHVFAAGEGIICNNILHDRTAFEDQDASESNRILYRARFRDRVLDT
jgi:hypothetical protein